jgi:AGCS family alanine or glycine:cation symporter
MTLDGGDLSYVVQSDDGSVDEAAAPAEIRINNGRQAVIAEQAVFAWHDLPVERFYTDEAQTLTFTGILDPATGIATADDGTPFTVLYGDAPESGAPLTQLGFRRGLAPLGDWGGYIVVFSVILFAISTAISWSYYGDRCAAYLFGRRAVVPYRLVYVGMVFLGTVIAPAAAWDLGDIALGIVILPNLLALIMLSGKTRQLMDSYFERKPWVSD